MIALRCVRGYSRLAFVTLWISEISLWRASLSEYESNSQQAETTSSFQSQTESISFINCRFLHNLWNHSFAIYEVQSSRITDAGAFTETHDSILRRAQLCTRESACMYPYLEVHTVIIRISKSVQLLCSFSHKYALLFLHPVCMYNWSRFDNKWTINDSGIYCALLVVVWLVATIVLMEIMGCQMLSSVNCAGNKINKIKQGIIRWILKGEFCEKKRRE